MQGLNVEKPDRPDNIEPVLGAKPVVSNNFPPTSPSAGQPYTSPDGRGRTITKAASRVSG